MFSQKQISDIRQEFPILKKIVYGYPLIYFDNAATTQKPKEVINAIIDFYYNKNANVHRGNHYISQLATIAMERTRKRFQNFIHAESHQEIIFTKGTTESINLVAYCMKEFIKKNDEIIISQLEHHSNIVPWQILCKQTGALLKIVTIDKYNLCLDMKVFESMLSEKTKIVAISHISNALGIINPIKQIIEKVHEYNAWVLIDGAQAPSHMLINVKELNPDFYVFSSHKMYGPTGIGILYGKKNILNQFHPYQSGGEMIKTVTMQKTTYAEIPFKFEAGTPNIEGIIASISAIDFIEKIGINKIQAYEITLLKYANQILKNIDDIIIYGDNKKCSNIISFNIKNIHPFDIGSILNRLGIAVRTGNHCAQPLMDFLKVPGTIRVSFGIYNTYNEIDMLYNGLIKAKNMLK